MRQFATAAAFALAATLALPAGAWTRTCASYTDPSGDVSMAPSADITEFAVAVEGDAVVARLAVQSLSFDPTDLGVQWSVAATLDHQDLWFWARRGAVNGAFLGGALHGDTPVDATLALVGDSIVWHAPLSALGGVSDQPGCGLSEFRAYTNVFSRTADVAPEPGTA